MNNPSREHPSPITLFIIIGISIAMADFAASYLIESFARPRILLFEAVDAFILVAISFPFLYFFMYRPMVDAMLVVHKAKEEAEAATKLKDKFVTLVVHDLRSPFSAIIGLLQLMERDTEAPLPPKHFEKIDRIMTVSNGMLRMIDEILDISRLQTGAIVPRLRFIEARVLAEDAIGCLLPLADKKKITLENRIPPKTKICADPSLYLEVIQNLASNAIKFTPEGGTVSLSLNYGSGASIEVRDSGIGMTDERAAHLFDEGEKTSTPGTAGERGGGFGLWLSQSIIMAHGGKITVSSALGKGSTFCAQLPPLKPRVLVVEHDIEYAKRVTTQLVKLDIAISNVQTVKGALELLERERHDLILADLTSPGGDVHALIDRIRGQSHINSIPLIVITASKDPADRIMAFDLGANDYLMKPINDADLIMHIKRFTG